ncbi:MAG: hypothetical protein K5650_02060 [Bacteroidales bacterium]|nr:hypothetical protein [Bacteroidales bacterium]
MKRLILLASIALAASLVQAQVIVTDTSDFQRVKHILRVDKTYCSGLSHVMAILPYMQSNHYQIIENPVVFSNGTVRNNAEGGNKYIGYDLYSSEMNQLSNVFELGMEFDVATININVDFNAIDTIYPYDTTSSEYTENIGAISEYVLPHHSHIDSVSNILWNQSTDIIDYARRCYLYTANQLNYINANTGIHSLQDIINNGGGDCGNFSSYYISLLRCRNIPARHVVTVLGMNDCHIWAEFYLQNYGWIPVDPTFKNGNPSGDYFGHKNSSHYVTTLGIGLTNYKFGAYDEPIQITLLQLDYWYWWYYNPCTSADFDFLVQRLPTATVKGISSDPIMGSVYGGGRFVVDSTATLTASAYSGYHFTHWSNGSTDNPYTFTVQENKTLTAFFAADGGSTQDTVYVHDTAYVVLHDTTYITTHDTITRIDTVTITEYIYVHDTTVVTDTIALTEYVPVHDTIIVNDTVTLTEYVTVHDTTIVTDTLRIVDTIYINDTIYIDTAGVGIDEMTMLKVKMYVQGTDIVIENADNNRVRIYDAVGRMLAVKQDAVSPVRFPVATSGVYVVKVGNLPARKIVVVR